MDSYAKLHPREYTTRFLEQNVRPDARTLYESRPCTIAAGSLETSFGSALVRLGATSIVAGVRCELGPVASDAVCTVVANVELLPICSPRFTAGKPPELA